MIGWQGELTGPSTPKSDARRLASGERAAHTALQL